MQMVNLSPTEESYQESFCSLKFAQQVNQCELGKPKRQIKDCKEAVEPNSSAMEVEEQAQTPCRGNTATSNTASKLKRGAVASTASKTATSRVKTTR